MARKDDLFVSFLTHHMLRYKYKLDSEKTPQTVREGLKSTIPIVKAIALIVENLEAPQPPADKDLRTLILQYLNEAAI